MVFSGMLVLVLLDLLVDFEVTGTFQDTPFHPWPSPSLCLVTEKTLLVGRLRHSGLGSPQSFLPSGMMPS